MIAYYADHGTRRSGEQGQGSSAQKAWQCVRASTCSGHKQNGGGLHSNAVSGCKLFACLALLIMSLHHTQVPQSALNDYRSASQLLLCM